MGALSQRKIEIVRMLVETAPDRIVGGLQVALADTLEDSALGSVRRLVDTEVADRRLRNVVLQPIVPMCVGAGDDRRALTFPARALPLIWRGLKAYASDKVRDAEDAFMEFSPEDVSAEAFDHLAVIAAHGLRAREYEEFRIAAELADQGRPGGAAMFADCLEVAGVVRRATARIPDWLGHPSEESTAGARLAYKDTVAIAEDAGPRFFEMLAAQMAQPWMVLRIISEVMDKPTERYLADSEMAGFGERVMEDIDDALKSIATLNLEGGPDAARAAGRLVELITVQIAELETCIELSKDHGWGHRIAKQKKQLASVVEGRLRDAEKYAVNALPTHQARIGRIRRQIPRLTQPPEPQQVASAITLLTFAQEIRSSANYGGFSSARVKVLEKLADYLDHYVEEDLDLMKTGEAEEAVALAFLDVAAEFALLVQGDKAADLVRRRATAAIHPEPPPLAAEG